MGCGCRKNNPPTRVGRRVVATPKNAVISKERREMEQRRRAAIQRQKG